jgi:acyl transferase domain-containing protein/NADPH:quinone reductase-like Zn-dependent oxidoreductase/acyl carrier protein/short-subunit dehydrogenase
MPEDNTTPDDTSMPDATEPMNPPGSAQAEPIAVIGMGCRFPGGANNPEEFWRLLAEERNAVSIIPEERWALEDFYDPNPEAAGKCYTRMGHFLSDPSPMEFDPYFFKITPREAKVMDPQQRIMLEVVWEALENAGIAPSSLHGSDTGVFLGCYDNHHLVDNDIRSLRDVEFYLATSLAQSITSGRISYFLNLHGPNFSVNTACSSSLVALHQACQSLQSGECNIAITGGVNVLVSASVYVSLAKAKMLSVDGLCKAFDNAANGYGRGEGCGVIVLKKLEKAIEDGDTILAIIRGSAVNHDGRTAGITAPNGMAQQKVIQSAIRNSGLSPDDIHYVEAHGTGTIVGDPIELNALADTFQTRSKDNPLRIGSVKTNIGHLEAAAGIAGVIKTILALNQEYLPRHINVSELNQQIEWDRIPIQVLTQGESWPIGTRHRFAGVSSFGFGGTNAHVILEGAEHIEARSSSLLIDRPKHILTLSAQTEQILQVLSQQYAEYMQRHSEIHLGDIAFTANTGRTHLPVRISVIGESTGDVADSLSLYASNEMSEAVIQNKQASNDTQEIGLLFTGQGSQYPDMGKGVYEYLPSFQEKLRTCDRILLPHIKQSLLEILYETEAPRKYHPVNQTAITQPALFSLEASLAQMLVEWGIRPAAVMGHSLGESVAAYIAGVYSLEDGLHLVAKRGSLMQSLPQNGSMVAAETDAHTIQSLIHQYSYENSAGIAAYNGPQSIVISGEQEPVEHIAQLLKEQGIRTIPLRVSHAFHSELMMPMVAPFQAFIDNLNLSQPQIPLVSTVTGKLAMDEITSSAHWGNGVRQPVRFEQAMSTMYDMGIRIFVEVGPHPVLSSMGQNCLPDNAELLWLPLLRKGYDDWSTILQALGHLYVKGIDIDWKAFDQDFKQKRRKVHLPTYPFHRQTHWLTGLSLKYQESISKYSLQTDHPLLGRRLQLPDNQSTYYENKFTPHQPGWINGHQFFGHPVLPAAAYLEMALALGIRHLNTDNVELHNVTLHNLLHIPETGVAIMSVVKEKTDKQFYFEIYSHPTDVGTEQKIYWELHASGFFNAFTEELTDEEPLSDISALYEQLPRLSSSGMHYKSYRLQGLSYGPEFQTVSDVKFSDDVSVAFVTLSSDIKQQNHYYVHPTILDGGIQLSGIILPVSPVRHNLVPVQVERLRYYGKSFDKTWCVCQTASKAKISDGQFCVNLSFCDTQGSPNVIIDNLYYVSMPETAFELSKPKWHDWLYKVSWQKREQAVLEKNTPSEGWLIFCDSRGVGQQLAELLQDAGHQCTVVNRGRSFNRIQDATYEIHPFQKLDYDKLLKAIQNDDIAHPKFKNIVILWGLDLEGLETRELILPEIIENDVSAALSVVQTQVDERAECPMKLILVTRGALTVNVQDSTSGFMQAPLWGLGRVINLEYPEHQCRMIDLEPEEPSEEALILFRELLYGGRNPETAYRDGIAYIPRLTAFDESKHADSDRRILSLPRTPAYQLKTEERGTLDTLYLAETDRQLPGSGEIEILVRATGLNFIDVLDVMNLLPFQRPALGGECAGEVSAVGESVTKFKVGDRVAALAPGSFSRYAITSEQFAVPIQGQLSYEQAASIPIVYLTAYFSLYHLAQLKPGDSILIHAAAGGVGWAAIQLAKRVGAEIYTTASPSKWDFLRSQDIVHIFNSRTLDFKEEILKATHEEGVDVVLNSLSGDYIPTSLSVLAPNGRFVEIGKRSIWQPSDVQALRDDIIYSVYDLITHMQESPSEVSKALSQLYHWIEDGELAPLPITKYSIVQAPTAFRLMQQAQHVGKIVVTQSDFQHGTIDNLRRNKLDGTYLITGGWGALGMEIASWLVFRGAKHIILLGRSKPSPKAAELIDMIRDSGVSLKTIKADVSDYEMMKILLGNIKDTDPPLRGIFHAAGILDDAVIANLTSEHFINVMRAKIQGAWNLHQLTLDLPLYFFVLYSSVASVFGSPGQGNYAAANAFLDSLVYYRKKLGINGLSINWGPWSEGGMATRKGTDVALKEHGVQPIPSSEGLQILQDLALSDATQVVVFPVDWKLAAQSNPFFIHMFSEFLDGKTTGSHQNHILEKILAAPQTMQYSLLTNHIRHIICNILHLPSATTFDKNVSFVDLGMDSLATVELRNTVQRSLGFMLPTTLFINYPTLEALITYLADKIGISPPQISSHISPEETQAPESIETDLDRFSTEELAARLDRKLDQLREYTYEDS